VGAAGSRTVRVEAEEAGQEVEVADEGNDVHADLSAEGGGAARVSPSSVSVPRCLRNKQMFGPRQGVCRM
jgi:hypothetical protein